jgi:hypothetical protein
MGPWRRIPARVAPSRHDRDAMRGIALRIEEKHMRHHRKLLRRLRALFPVTDRRGVIVERVGNMLGTWWRVMRPLRIMVAGSAVNGRCAIAESSRRCDALQEALRRRAREVRA